MYANKEIEELKKDIRMREREIVDIRDKICDISMKILKKVPIKYYETETGAVKITGRDKEGFIRYREFYIQAGGDLSFATYENFKSLIGADEWVATLGKEITKEEFVEWMTDKFKKEIEKY